MCATGFLLTNPPAGSKKKSIPNASEQGQRSLLFMGVALLDEINSTVYFHAWSAEMMFKICAGFW